MARFEYKVVPAPEKARKVRGLKGADLFAHEIEAVINTLAADGWVYVRADTLPQEMRSGLTSKITTYRNLLVFQREIVTEAVVAPTSPAPEPARAEPEAEPDADIENLWQPSEEAEKVTRALFPDRQR